MAQFRVVKVRLPGETVSDAGVADVTVRVTSLRGAEPRRALKEEESPSVTSGGDVMMTTAVDVTVTLFVVADGAPVQEGHETCKPKTNSGGGRDAQSV